MTSYVPLNDEDSSEKCVVCCFIRWEHHRVHLHNPRWYSLLHTWAVWYRLLLLDYKPVQLVTVQNYMRLYQVQEKMMQSRDKVSTKCMRLLQA